LNGSERQIEIVSRKVSDITISKTAQRFISP